MYNSLTSFYDICNSKLPSQSMINLMDNPIFYEKVCFCLLPNANELARTTKNLHGHHKPNSYLSNINLPLTLVGACSGCAGSTLGAQGYVSVSMYISRWGYKPM